VRLLDLVEDEDGVGRAVDGVGQKAALVEADVAGRGADEARHGMRLHVLAHVEAQELDAEDGGELLGQLGLADARRPGEEEGADGVILMAEPRTRELDGVDDLGDGLVLAVDDGL
jgi:hypothetical protein